MYEKGRSSVIEPPASFGIPWGHNNLIKNNVSLHLATATNRRKQTSRPYVRPLIDWRPVPQHVSCEGCAGRAGAEPQTWGTDLMNDIILFVGLDVHKATVAVAVAEGGRGGDVRRYGTIREPPGSHPQNGGAAWRGRRTAPVLL